MKNRYLIDNSNRLIIERRRKRLTAQGRFSLDKGNRLRYWLNEPISWRRRYSLPRKITFEGLWQLNPNYDLELILDKTRGQHENDILIIKGKIISTDEDSLVFEVKSFDKEGLLHIQILKISGFWQADEYNRLSFSVEKKTLPDILTLEGNWQINQNQQIVYTYEKTDLKRKTKVSHKITFLGFWQINSNNRLVYILSRSSQSQFDFRAQLESPTLYPRKGKIRYRLGVGLKKEKRFQYKIISLYGAWKLSRKLGLIFEMNYGKNKIQSIEFGADISLSPKDEIIFSLRNKEREPLGLKVIFTHKFLNKLDAQVFLRLKRNIEKESAVEAGVRIPF